MPRLPAISLALVAITLFSQPLLLVHEQGVKAKAAGLPFSVVSDTTSEAQVTAAPAKVVIIDDAFKPARLTIAAGTTVTWSNKDDDPHTVTSVQPLFDSKGMARGDSFSYTFSTPGSYTYYCKVHPFMKAVVEVKGARS